jgi:hypothetical protein
MAEPKTKPTKLSVDKFIKAIPDEQTRADCATVARLMNEATRAEGQMWGTNIVGFGSKHYKYASGREGDWPLVAFSPRKQNLTLYVGLSAAEQDGLLEKLGKHSVGKGCLYIKRLSDVDVRTLQKIIKAAANRRKD